MLGKLSFLTIPWLILTGCGQSVSPVASTSVGNATTVSAFAAVPSSVRKALLQGISGMHFSTLYMATLPTEIPAADIERVNRADAAYANIGAWLTKVSADPAAMQPADLQSGLSALAAGGRLSQGQIAAVVVNLTSLGVIADFAPTKAASLSLADPSSESTRGPCMTEGLYSAMSQFARSVAGNGATTQFYNPSRRGGAAHDKSGSGVIPSMIYSEWYASNSTEPVVQYMPPNDFNPNSQLYGHCAVTNTDGSVTRSAFTPAEQKTVAAYANFQFGMATNNDEFQHYVTGLARDYLNAHPPAD
jgi:hypothetical protein